MKQQSNPWISISDLLSSVVLILLLLFIMASIVPKFSMDSQRLEMMNQINLALKEYEKEGLVKVHRESGVLEFTSVTFDQGSAQLNSNTEHLVEEMSKKLQVYLKEKPNLEILIEGHTDPSAVHNVVNIGFLHCELLMYAIHCSDMWVLNIPVVLVLPVTVRLD